MDTITAAAAVHAAYSAQNRGLQSPALRTGWVRVRDIDGVRVPTDPATGEQCYHPNCQWVGGEVLVCTNCLADCT